MKNRDLIGLVMSLFILGMGALLALFPQRFYSAETPEEAARNRKYFRIAGYIALSLGVIFLVHDLLRLVLR